MSDPAAYATIVLDCDGAVARLFLARPQKKNPIGPLTLGELVHALGRVAADPALRVVILSGQGDTFSAGADLAQLQGGAQAGALPPASFPQLFGTMHALGKPIIAMVNGAALAGGLGLVCACDLAIAADTALLGTTELNVGLWPMMIGAEIIRVVGKKRALELMLTGRKLPAAEALAWGLVNRVVPAAELAAATDALALALAARSPTALAHGLSAFYQTQDLDYAAGLGELERRLMALLGTEDAAEGLGAFLARRAPVWKGK
jgi:enoyl-CoA hydratase/carnithine racemase